MYKNIKNNKFILEIELAFLTLIVNKYEFFS